MEPRTDFYTSAIFWKDLREKALSVKEISKLLNDNLSLEKYGQGIKKIFFIPMAVRPTNRIHEESVKYLSKKRELHIALKLDFEAVSRADEPAFFQLLALLFLRAIDEAPQHKMKDFDWGRFKKDVTELFEAEGWLQVA